MTGKENYKRAIEFKGPQYLPTGIGVSLDWMYDKDERKRERVKMLASRFPDDTVGWLTPTDFGESQEPVNNVRRWKDQWGTGWEDDGHGAKTEGYPLESGYEALTGYTFPDPLRPTRFDSADERLKQRGDRYVQGCVWFTLFERLWMLRGFDNMLMDPYMDEANFARLRDRVVEYNLAIIDQWVKRDVDGVFFSDDWGCQRGLLMNPDDWRRFYKPSYKRMFERVRSGGAHVWMHLCGNITAILPDLIEIGLNVLNPVQPQAMDVRQLSREFGGKVCFNGGLDVQGTLVRGTREDVKREVHELVDLFGKFNGGYIGGTSHSVMPETPLDNVIAMYEAF
ncbi:MAG: uroporphyrinogen decarboxylase family protein, partial [Kiritimatiellia bacterium]